LNLKHTNTIEIRNQSRPRELSTRAWLPVNAALLQAYQLKLDLRRARGQETDPRRSECLSSLLNLVERISSSLEELNSEQREHHDRAISVPNRHMVAVGASE
jgi:hypothetical protein